jgi:hypothetical protein
MGRRRGYEYHRGQWGPQRSRKLRRETTIQTLLRYAAYAVAVGLVAAMTLQAYDNYKARQAVLAALPNGFVFSGCDDVRARGLAPLSLGEPGYGEHMDRDGDGIACEPYP